VEPPTGSQLGQVEASMDDFQVHDAVPKSGECYGSVGGTVLTRQDAQRLMRRSSRPPTDATMTALCYHTIKTDEMILRSHRVYCDKSDTQDDSI
jgi:hypothetical protein